MSGVKIDGPFEQIMLITERLTKYAVTISLSKGVSSLEIAEIILAKFVLEYIILEFVILDCNKKLTNSLLEDFMSRLDIGINFSKVNSSQGDRQIERLNKMLVRYLDYIVKMEPNKSKIYKMLSLCVAPLVILHSLY